MCGAETGLHVWVGEFRRGSEPTTTGPRGGEAHTQNTHTTHSPQTSGVGEPVACWHAHGLKVRGEPGNPKQPAQADSPAPTGDYGAAKDDGDPTRPRGTGVGHAKPPNSPVDQFY